MTKMAEISLSWYPIYDQNSRKSIPFGAAHTYKAHIREYPPPLVFNFNLTFGLKLQVGGVKIVTVHKRSIFQVEWLIATLI